MSKIGLIIQREYVTRVRKKTFILISVLGPLIFAGLIFLPIILGSSKNQNQRIVLVDENQIFCGILKPNATAFYDYGYCSIDLESVKKLFADSVHVSVLYIKKEEKVTEDFQVQLFSKEDPGSAVISTIEYQLNNIIEKGKMRSHNLDQATIDAVKSNVNVKNFVNDKKTERGYIQMLAYAASILIYMFILFYSVQVMRGVMEEKVNRIVEVIISSVRPFQLMMGKVIGVGLVGLTQFLIWLLLGYGAFQVGSSYVQSQLITPNTTTAQQTLTKGLPVQNDNMDAGSDVAAQKMELTKSLNDWDDFLRNTNWFLVLGGFLFYFLGGYMLYSALFAAVGSAVDQETETQQFMLPVTAPLILSIYVMINILSNPNSTMAVWFSMIPFTAPIAMMARIPFGIPWWQLPLSMGILIASIFGTVWLAGRIYRVGLLMYGKKVTYRELGKWLFYK